eukprot:GHVO01016765.1.p1 GENE.GHVO01016765.1~~GHVO01016765.1.p1  ORF type:complete len:244 (-),score=27.49 GHVO01016765.1:220-951(-)
MVKGEYRVVWALPNMSVDSSTCCDDTLFTSLLNDEGRAHPTCLNGSTFTDAKVHGCSDHVYISPYINSKAVFGHNNISAFISHCGSGSVHESLYMGIPTICIPFMGDQFLLCDRIRRIRAGMCLDRLRFHAHELYVAVHTVQDPLYREAAARIGVIQKAYGGVGRAADVVEMAASLPDLSMFHTLVDHIGVWKAFGFDLLLYACAVMGIIIGTVSYWAGERSVGVPPRWVYVQPYSDRRYYHD